MAGTIVACPQCGTKVRVPVAAAGTPRCPQCKSPLPWIVNATDADFDAAIESTKVPVLVDLWAPWCGPCRQLSPALETVAKQRPGTLKLVKVDVDDNPMVSQRFGIQAIPTLLLFQHGAKVAEQRGAVPVAALRSWIDASLTT